MSLTPQAIVEPLYIVPVLVEQPTWGGKYIAEFKDIENQATRELNIGQSYELYKDSLVFTGEFQPIFQLGRAGKTDSLETYNATVPLTSLSNAVATINQNLGIQSTPAWPLIKFTQAQENSYQAHVKPGTKTNWLPKPESWYFFEEGYATLGLTQETCENPTEYKKRCVEIDAFAKETSKKVKNGTLTLEEARQELENFIEKKHPRKYVNSIRIPKNATVDLSQGGVHHSWEAHPDIPNGNIVYEVQQDVADNDSTLRSFDQAKIKDDGSVRPLTIDDYFTYLDTSLENNNPKRHIALLDSLENQQGTVQNIFNTRYYKLDQYQITNQSQTVTLTTDIYQHIFVKEGDITVTFEDKKWLLPQGWSMVLPPLNKNDTDKNSNYILIPNSSKNNQVNTILITTNS